MNNVGISSTFLIIQTAKGILLADISTWIMR